MRRVHGLYFQCSTAARPQLLVLLVTVLRRDSLGADNWYT